MYFSFFQVNIPNILPYFGDVSKFYFIIMKNDNLCIKFYSTMKLSYSTMKLSYSTMKLSYSTMKLSYSTMKLSYSTMNLFHYEFIPL